MIKAIKTNLKTIFIVIYFVVLICHPSLAHDSIKSQNKEKPKAQLLLVETSIFKIDKDHSILPIWIKALNSTACSVKLEIAKIISPHGIPILMENKIEPVSIDISPDDIGEIFQIIFAPSTLEKNESGKYIAIIRIKAENAEPITKQYSFEITPTKTFIETVIGSIKWIRDNLLVILWNFAEIIIFVLSILFILFFSKLAWKGSHSLNVLPITNETGEKGEFEGVASGIDDILIAKLQEIRQLSSTEELKHYWIIPSEKARQGGKVSTAKATEINIAGGEILLEIQKLGDISIGSFKIPIGSIIAFITKIFGGNYISGALQKYGKVNKIILRLEQRPSVFELLHKRRRKTGVYYFETSWPSDTIKTEKLPEGVPIVIEELACEITLKLSEKVDTNNWQAYKKFLYGNRAYDDFYKNRTRKDCLRHATDCWRESVRLDPNFAKAHFNLGLALDLDGKYEDAIFRYNKAISLNPELIGAEAHYSLAKLYLDVMRDEIKTLDELKKAKAINPDLPEIYNLEGLVYSRRKEDKNAAVSYEKAIDLSHKNPEPVFYYNLSTAGYYLKDYVTAQKAGEQAVTIYWERLLKEHYGTPVLKIYEEKDKIRELVKNMSWNRNIRELLQTLGWIHNKKGAVVKQSNASEGKTEYDNALNYFEEGLKIEPDNRDMLDGYGEALRESDRFKEALLIQRRLIRLWPEYYRGYLEIAETMKKLKKSGEKVDTFEKIGYALLDEKVKNALNIKYDIKQFEIECIKAVNLDTTLPYQFKLFHGVLGGIFHYFWGSTKDENKKLEAEAMACVYFEKIFKPEFKDIDSLLEPEFRHTYSLALTKLGKPVDASEQLEISADQYQKEQYYDLATCYFDLATVYLKAKCFKFSDEGYGEAIQFYKKADLSILASDTHVSRTDCLIEWYWEGGDTRSYDWAREECNKAIQLNNSNSAAFHVKGNTYHEFKRYAEAIPQYEMAVEINYDLPGAHYNMGLCYMYMEKYEEAVKKFEASIILDERYADPDNLNKPDPYKYMTYCLEKLGQLNRAVEILKEAINLFPVSAKYNLLLGEYLSKTNLLDEAADKFRIALDIDKENSQGLKHIVLNCLADLYAEQGVDIDMAYRMCRDALVISKANLKKAEPYDIKPREELAQIKNTLGWILYLKNQTKHAIDFLEKSLEYTMGSPKSRARLAYAYERYAKQYPDEIIKENYSEKAKTQWKFIIDLNGQTKWKKIAEEHLS